MKCRPILVALVCSLVVCADSAIAQKTDNNKAHLAAAHDLLKTMQSERTFGESIEVMLDLQLKQNPLIAPYRDTMFKFFTKYMSWNSMKDEMAQIYVEAFTIRELRELTAFYKTPVGTKAVLLIPQLMNKGGELGMKRVQEHMHEFQQMIAEESKRLAEKDIPNKPDTGNGK